MVFSLFCRIARTLWMAMLLCVALTTTAWAAHPALWQAHDADTTVYFFGTVHALPKDADWHFPALDKALDASDVLYIEATDADTATLAPLVMKYGLDRSHPLSDKLTQKENGLLKQAVQRLDLPGGMTAMNMMKPWLAGITIATAPLLKAGYDPKLGADKQLQTQMEKADKPVKGLESAKKQILILTRLPESAQLHLLRQSLNDYENADAMLKTIVTAWMHGDVKSLAHTIVVKMKKRSPKLYQSLIVKRNKHWADKIADIMKTTPGTIFVAVGAGHLAGPDRVQLQLESKGIPTRRIND